MKQSEIKAGATYRNRGKGRTQRRVLGIGAEFRPDMRWANYGHAPDAPGIQYQQMPTGGTLWSEPRLMWLDSFASWAGAEVKQ